jgi:dynein heavy chain
LWILRYYVNIIETKTTFKSFLILRNPTYSGRFELPDNLKPMFRPIAMMIPHYSLIGEGNLKGISTIIFILFSLVILFSVGFTSAKVLATKIVYLYNLSNSQLSQQDHYDFGMRAIKAVLLMAGEIKRSYINNSNLTDEQAEVKFLFDKRIFFI